jgi:uncharacterized protein involved in exopolysaccharide biosynthesis
MNTTLEPQGTLRDILYIIFKHRVKMLILFFTVVLTVTLGSFLMSPTYEASSKILLKFGRENVYSPPTPGSGGSAPVLLDPSREERINSEVEMLQGRSILEKVIHDIGPATIYPDIDSPPLIALGALAKLSPADKAFVIFQKKLSVEAVKKSNIIEIKFQHKDPAVAALVVNRLVDVFLDHHLKVYQESGEYSFFSSQVRALEKKLKDSEQELKDFKNTNRITSLQEQKSVLLKQISDAEMELARTKSARSETEGKLSALKQSSSGASTDRTLGQETDFNPQSMSVIRSRVSELRLEEERLLSRYTEQNENVVKVRKELAEARQLLAKEEQIYHNKALATVSQNLSALKSREAEQEKLLSRYQSELNQVNSVEMRVTELERQVKINEDNYQLYLKKMEEARISNAMDSQKIANISVVEPALAPIKPIKPKKLLNIILSILLGAFSSIGMAFTLEYFSHTFNKPEEVEQQSSLKVLAAIPSIKR